MKALKTARLMVHLARIIKDPNRLDQVFALVEDIRDPETLGPVRDAFLATVDGRRALQERIRVGAIPLAELRALPAGTLGRTFAKHLDDNHLDPNALPSLPGKDDYDYVLAHLYETHDIWHAVTGFGADVPGELGLQAFYLAAFPARLGAALLAAGMANTFLYRFDERDARMTEISRGYRMGKRARSLLGVDWKFLWAVPLSEVRARYSIDVEPLSGAARAAPPHPLRVGLSIEPSC